MTSPSTTAPAAVAPSAGRGYLSLWRSVPRELLFLLVAFPLALVGFVVSLTLFSAALGTLVTFFIGVIVMIVALYAARGFGTLQLALLDFAGRPAIPRPRWDAAARPGFFGWLRSVFANGHYWLYLLHVMFVDFVLTTITWSITVTWVAVGAGGVSYWFWSAFIENVDRDFFVSQWLVEAFGGTVVDPVAADNVLQFILGVVALVTLPFITRGLTLLHWNVARGLLGAFRSDALAAEVATLTESRGAAVSAEGQSLRRLERDIHDGPQQRLVRLQMDLAAAERQLDGDPEKARTLLAEAAQQSKEALEELRALSRGFAPPILMDRGLAAALESATGRSPVPARLVNELPGEIVVPDEIERNAYFVVSEALANVSKHAEASDVTVRVGVDGEEQWLEVSVTDDGVGGAASIAEHGLAGLAERLRGVGGQLAVTSPDGGPTVVSARLPLAYP